MTFSFVGDGIKHWRKDKKWKIILHVFFKVEIQEIEILLFVGSAKYLIHDLEDDFKCFWVFL